MGFTLIIGEFMNQITLTWQGEAEEEWSVLNELVELIFDCLPEGIRRA